MNATNRKRLEDLEKELAPITDSNKLPFIVWHLEDDIKVTKTGLSEQHLTEEEYEDFKIDNPDAWIIDVFFGGD